MLRNIKAVNDHQLVDILRYRVPIWKSLLSMLRPLDIVSLTRATHYCIRPTKEELMVYMPWWRQIFHNIGWVEQVETAIVVGKDLIRLQGSIRHFTYLDTTQIKLLILVKVASRDHGTENAVRQSISASFALGFGDYCLPKTEEPVQLFVSFRQELTFLLHPLIAKRVSERLFVTCSTKLHKQHELKEYIARGLYVERILFGGQKDYNENPWWEWKPAFA